MDADAWWCSPALVALLREAGQAEAAEHRGFLPLVHADDTDRVLREFEACMANTGRLETDFRLVTAEDSACWARVSASAHRDNRGAVAFVSGDLRDVTAEKLAVDQLHETQRLLHQKDRVYSLDCLAGGIAHEFNNVLQAVRGYVSFAMDEVATDSQASSDLEQALLATDRAAALTRNLLDFVRTEEEASERHDLRDLLSELDDLLRPVIGEGVTFRTVSPNCPLVSNSNAEELRQSLLNLCINARDAMPDGGELVVTAEAFEIDSATAALFAGLAEGTYCRLRVTDSGEGIPPEHVERVFDPFFSTKEVGRGTGLGLATVYGFVQRSGGRVVVYSEPGCGATFSLYLPIEEIDGMNNDPQSPELRCEPSSVVLLVEDDPQVREVGRRSLQAAGYGVLVAVDGESGLEAYVANADRIELVVLDVVLPGLGGRRVFEEIRRLQSDVPVIFTTGFDPESAVGASGGQLADATLGKPYDRQQLLTTVKSLIAARRPVAAPH